MVALGDGLEPVTVRAQRLKVRWGVVVPIPVNVVHIQLTCVLSLKAAPRARTGLMRFRRLRYATLVTKPASTAISAEPRAHAEDGAPHTNRIDTATNAQRVINALAPQNFFSGDTTSAQVEGTVAWRCMEPAA
jgi:hypothetical protein